jgi:hypothetical protein
VDRNDSCTHNRHYGGLDLLVKGAMAVIRARYVAWSRRSLKMLAGDLRCVVHYTMQPTNASLWLPDVPGVHHLRRVP